MRKQEKSSQAAPWTGLKVIHPHAAGLDLASDEIWAAVPPDSTDEPVRVFGNLTPDLAALADWLTACHVDTVAMEATGVYPGLAVQGRLDSGVRVSGGVRLRGVCGECAASEERAWAQE